MGNTFKTTVLLGALTLLFVFLGEALGGQRGMITAFFFACTMNFAAYWWSDKIVLGMYGARPVSENEAPEIYAIVRELSSNAKIPMPAVYVIPSASPNAFATGRNPAHAAVAVTHGILEILNPEELKGVLAHELGHVLNRDILTSTIAATLAGAIGMLASMAKWAFMFGGVSSRRDEEGESNPIVLLLAAFLMPMAAGLIQLAVSRSREYAADEAGAHLSGNPLYLASALRKLEAGSRQSRFFQAEAAPASAHLFIVNPLKGQDFAALFMTHPPIERRIVRLEQMAREKGF